MTDPSSHPNEVSRHSNRPPAGDVRAQRDRILASPVFAQSKRLQKFLRFIVEEALAGRADGLKEYTIALDVFERDESFDPQTSSIVCVEASRLRSKLKAYYAAEGRDDPVQIRLPTGSYAPTFETVARDAAPDGRPPSAGGARHLIPVRPALLAVALLAFAAALFLGVADRKPGGDGPVAAAERTRAHAIAVLPFRSLSGKAGEDYFTDGLTDALIAGLAKQQSVRVTSLASAMAYKNLSRPISEIAAALNVDHVVEGSIRRSGERVQITARLIEAATGRQLWAESYERDVADVLAFQDDVARRIVAALSGDLDAVPAAGPQTASAVDPEAQEAYLKGRYFRNQLTAEGFRKGIAYFRQAVEMAPGYAKAHAGIATCYCLLGGHGFELVEPGEGMPAAKNAVLEALSLDNTLAEPHAFLGVIRLKYEWDWPGAEEAFKRSIRLNPSYALARLFYSFYLEAMGRQEEAIREAEEARLIDPLSLQTNINLGWQYLQGGFPERAKLVFESTAELDPDFWGVHWGLGHYYREKGAYDTAIAAFQKAVESGGGYTLPLTALGYTYAIAGQPAAARAILVQLEALAEDGYVSPFNMATIYVGLGEADEAFIWLEKAFEKRSRSLAWLNVTKEYDGLRSDPRFKALLGRIGLPERTASERLPTFPGIFGSALLRPKCLAPTGVCRHTLHQQSSYLGLRRGAKIIPTLLVNGVSWT